MTQIEIFKKVLHAVNLKKYKIKADVEVNNFKGFFYMLSDNPEFSTLNIRFEKEHVEQIFGERFAKTGLTDDNIFKRGRFSDRGFDWTNIYELALLDKKNCCKFLDKFEKFMIELSQTLDGVTYTPGDLCGYVDVGLPDVKMVVKAGISYVRNIEDSEKWDPMICAKIFFITDQNNVDMCVLQTMFAGIYECTCGMNDYVFVNIPEHRWFHKKGDSRLKTYFTIGNTDSFTNLYKIRDEIIYIRTRIDLMEITP